MLNGKMVPAITIRCYGKMVYPSYVTMCTELGEYSSGPHFVERLGDVWDALQRFLKRAEKKGVAVDGLSLAIIFEAPTDAHPAS